MTKMMRDTAYSAFKTSLFEEKIRPGQFLSLRELCEALDVSMSPLRDALGRLEGEGLVELLPQRGVRIAMVDRKFIRNAFQVRRFLEVGACRDLIDPETWPELKTIRARTQAVIEAAENGVDESLLQEAYDIDWALHNGLVAVMNNEVLTDIHRSNADKVRLIRLNARFTPSRVLPAMREHLVVIDALLEKRSEDAARALSEHLSISEARALGTQQGLV
jgi:DNA-binding GntR family transcriptional regulator